MAIRETVWTYWLKLKFIQNLLGLTVCIPKKYCPRSKDQKNKYGHLKIMT